MRLAPHRLRLAALNRAKISLSYRSLENRALSSENATTNFAWPMEARLSALLSTKLLTKLPRLSESASLSHRYFIKRMNIHPQKINLLSAVGTFNEFFRKTHIFNEY